MSDAAGQNGAVEPPLVTTNKEQKIGNKNLVKPADRIQEMLRASKALKEERKSALDARHDFLFNRLADSIGIDAATLEDMILGDEKFDQIEHFLGANGSKMLIFFYQDVKTTEKNVIGKPIGTTSKKKLMISNGEEEQLEGHAYYFLKSNTKAITASNIANEVNFGVLDATNGKLLDAVEKMLANVILPALSGLEDWGSLKSRNNPQVQYYVETLDHFIGSINGLKSNMSDQIKLIPSDYDNQLTELTTLSDYQNMSMNGEFLDKCEELLGAWCQQIAKVLTESEQIRREADDTGPYSELHYWKQRMAKFNNLLEQIKSQRVKSLVGILQAAKSKSLNRWKEMVRNPSIFCYKNRYIWVNLDPFYYLKFYYYSFVYVFQ